MSEYEIKESQDLHTQFALFVNFDFTTFDVVVKESKQQKGMDKEIATIEKNNTWS